MRVTHLHHIAWGALLANESLVPLLQDAATGQMDVHLEDRWDLLRRRCATQVGQTMVERWPRRFRANEVERSVAQLCTPGLIETPSLPCLDEADHHLLERHGDYLRYRPREAQLYAALAGELDPLLIAGWHLSGWLARDQEVPAHDVQRIVAAQLAMLTPPDHLHRPMADNHVHLGGTAGDDAVMVGLLLATRCADPLWRPARRWVSAMVDRLQGQSADPVAYWQEQAAIRLKVEEHEALLDWVTLAEVPLSKATDARRAEGLRGLAQAMLRGSHAEAALWWWVLLWGLYRSGDAVPQDRAAVLMLVNAFMGGRRRLIVDRPGIRYFTRDYYRPAQRAHGLSDERPATKEGLRRVLQGPADKAELKAAPGTFDAGFVHQMVDYWADWSAPLRDLRLPGGVLCRSQWEALRGHQQELERWHFCLHFLRSSPDGKARGQPSPGLRKRREIWETALSLGDRLQSERGWAGSPLQKMAEALGQRFVPGRWVRGLDVAGDESAWPIEYFAGPLRWLRRGLLSRSPHEPASSGFHLSIHAGEDYSHPVSGMRHVDETVRYCEMREGDRLGHALALGIPPEIWLDRHGEVLMPVSEHLDNLVWVWHHAVALAPRLPQASQAIARLQLRIVRLLPHVDWARDVFQSSAATTQAPAMCEALWDAWMLRRNCPWQLSRPEPASAQFVSGVPDHGRLLSAQDSLGQGGSGPGSDLASRLYLSRHARQSAVLPSPDPDERPEASLRSEPLVRVSVVAARASREQPPPRPGLPLQDWEDEQDLELMLALQDYLLDRYASLGLCIEANPTSNLYIARLSSLKHHPIFRWAPPDPAKLNPGEAWNRFSLRGGAMPVIVNTDDPGVMPTTLRMEFELLREAAMDLGEPRHEVEAWLERLRQAGLDHFDRHHLPVFVPAS